MTLSYMEASMLGEWNTQAERLKDTISEFLDIVERPVGPLKNFSVPKTEEADRKILALYDAVDRIP